MRLTTDMAGFSTNRARYWAGAALLVNATIWGLSWLPLRHLNEAGVHVLWSTAALSAFAAVWTLLSQRLHLSDFLHQPYLWLLMLVSGLTNVFFNWGVTIGDVSRVVLLFYLMPAWANLFAWVFLRETLTRSAVFQLILSLAGVILVLSPKAKGLALPISLADYLGLAGGMCFALTNVMLRKLRTVHSSSRMMAMFGGGFAVATLALLIGLAHGSVPTLPPLGSWLLVLALLCIAVLCGNLCLQYGTSHLLIQTVALLMLTEVLVATLSAFWAGVSTPTLSVILGGICIGLSAVWSILGNPRKA